MKCQHMACHQCEDADLAAMRDERDSLRAEVERLRAEVDAAREALGLAWCSDGSSLADGIRRKTHALESMIK